MPNYYNYGNYTRNNPSIPISSPSQTIPTPKSGGKIARAAIEPFNAHEAISAITKLPLRQKYAAGIELLRQLSKASAACLIDLGDHPQIALRSGVIEPQVGERLIACSLKVKDERKARTDRFKFADANLVVLIVPVLTKGQVGSSLALVCPYEAGRRWNELISTLQWFAVLVYGIENDRAREREYQASIRIAGFVEVMEKAFVADDLQEASAVIVDAFCNQVGCDRGAIATVKRGGVCLRAISGVSPSETTRSEGATAIETLMREAVRSNRQLEGSSKSGSLITPELKVLGADTYLCAPLCDQGKVIGAWLFIWNETPEDIEDRIRYIKTVSPLFGPQLQVLRKTKPGALGSRVRRLWKRAGKQQKGLAISIVAILGLLTLLPVPIAINSSCSLEPEFRRTVSAPFDGTIYDTMVKPGEIVETGQILAQLDDREIQWQLADSNARRLRAEKQADAAMSQGNVADSQVARLEAESLIESAKVLRNRQQNLFIKSPIRGRILQGDLERSKGATVRKGEMLFEVGSLKTMVAEIEVNESDVSLIRPDAPVKLKFDSQPGKSWETQLRLISPRSEFRNGSNVFICEAAIENPDKGLRPGSLGRAKVEGPRYPAIWGAIRKPVNWILKKMP